MCQELEKDFKKCFESFLCRTAAGVWKHPCAVLALRQIPFLASPINLFHKKNPPKKIINRLFLHRFVPCGRVKVTLRPLSSGRFGGEVTRGGWLRKDPKVTVSFVFF